MGDPLSHQHGSSEGVPPRGSWSSRYPPGAMWEEGYPDSQTSLKTDGDHHMTLGQEPTSFLGSLRVQLPFGNMILGHSPILTGSLGVRVPFSFPAGSKLGNPRKTNHLKRLEASTNQQTVVRAKFPCQKFTALVTTFTSLGMGCRKNCLFKQTPSNEQNPKNPKPKKPAKSGLGSLASLVFNRCKPSWVL